MWDFASPATRTNQAGGSGRRWTRSFLVAALTLGFVGPAAAQSEGAGSQPPAATPRSDSKSKKQLPAPHAEKPKPAAEARDSFEPREKIRVDSTVSFPVDI